MNIFIIIISSIFISLFIVAKILGVNLFKKNMNKEYEKRLKIHKENEKKILLLNKELKTDEEIKLYIELNRFNLPKDKEWDKLLPKMIKELLKVGWNTEIKIYTKITYGSYRIDLITENTDLRIKSNKIISKYIEKFEIDNL
jgi:hypothetical protein